MTPRPFASIDPADQSEPEGTRHAAELLQWADNEGGIVGLIRRDGPDAFPAPLWDAARTFAAALGDFEQAVTDWAGEQGVAR